jgi:hypothetical protein
MQEQIPPAPPTRIGSPLTRACQNELLNYKSQMGKREIGRFQSSFLRSGMRTSFPIKGMCALICSSISLARYLNSIE